MLVAPVPMEMNFMEIILIFVLLHLFFLKKCSYAFLSLRVETRKYLICKSHFPKPCLNSHHHHKCSNSWQLRQFRLLSKVMFSGSNSWLLLWSPRLHAFLILLQNYALDWNQSHVVLVTGNDTGIKTWIECCISICVIKKVVPTCSHCSLLCLLCRHTLGLCMYGSHLTCRGTVLVWYCTEGTTMN